LLFLPEHLQYGEMVVVVEVVVVVVVVAVVVMVVVNAREVGEW
jgi:hypothetical protein